jgi:hypothetical protein
MKVSFLYFIIFGTLDPFSFYTHFLPFFLWLSWLAVGAAITRKESSWQRPI